MKLYNWKELKEKNLSEDRNIWVFVQGDLSTDFLTTMKDLLELEERNDEAFDVQAHKYSPLDEPNKMTIKQTHKCQIVQNDKAEEFEHNIEAALNEEDITLVNIHYSTNISKEGKLIYTALIVYTVEEIL